MPPPTITTSCLAEAGGREKILPSRIWWQMRLSSPSTLAAWLSFASPVCAATNERSTGHPAVTAPATTNLMKSLRFALTSSLLRSLQQFRAQVSTALAAHAQAIPENDGHQRENEDYG